MPCRALKECINFPNSVPCPSPPNLGLETIVTPIHRLDVSHAEAILKGSGKAHHSELVLVLAAILAICLDCRAVRMMVAHEAAADTPGSFCPLG